MAVNKTKLVENAQKYLHQGKVAQAIGEYQQILKQEPRDQVTLMTVGDLFVRQGETFQALEYFERLANLFLADGFITKAIAIYKKIAKLAPEETRPVERLAELYVQQGVLSEARPIYLQLAELHQRAGRQTQAAALLRKLLEAEPDNLRVQTRLAELSLAMNQPGEAAAAFRAAADQLHRRGDHAEAIKYADRALKVDPNDTAATMLKAQALAAAGRRPDAVAELAATPHLEAGGETAQLLLGFYLDSGETAQAVDLAARIFAHDSKHFAAAHRVAVASLDSGDAKKALTLLDLIRESMTDAGEHEALSQSLLRVAEQLPGTIEVREWLVDLYGRTSDSFRMPDALVALAEAYEAANRLDDAKRTYEKLLDRDSENESVRRKYNRLLAHLGGAPIDEAPSPKESAPAPESISAPAESAGADEDETQRFISQALTDVDLFSSYGLTQKAIDLLEVVLERVPRHAATLERLLDLHLGAGHEQRTAELASHLEQIHRQQGDSTAADRFAELHRRFHRVAAQAPNSAAIASAPAPMPEFSVPVDEPLSATIEEIVEGDPAEELPVVAVATNSAIHEVDLSDEWAALAGQLADLSPSIGAEVAETAPAPIPAQPPESVEPISPDPQIDPWKEAASEHVPVEPANDAPSVPEPPSTPEFTLELEPAPANRTSSAPALSADDFLKELSSDLDAALPSLAVAEAPPQSYARAREEAGNLTDAPPQKQVAAHASAGPLSEVFDEFRAEFGEIGAEDEDLETHYNLGIAYREMGLLEEAISEFQRVAKGSPAGQAFRYAMQCCTLLGLAFMEKGQPSIAAMWYERALQTPGLDQESVLALRYDLGVAQELAGDMVAAQKSFTQVYGMNIDYRDVAERLASFGQGQ